MKRLFSFATLAAAVAGCTTGPSDISDADGLAGSVVVETLNSSVLGRAWSYSTYLPTGYTDSTYRYPVVYLLHGSGGDEHSWADGFSMLDSLITAGVVPPSIAVAPATGTSWWVDGVEPFETAFVAELIPAIDARHRTIASREGRAVAGFSMGGYGSVRYALAYPNLFGAAIALSPALYDVLPPEESSARRSGAFGEPFDETRWHELNYPAVLGSHESTGLEVPLFIVVGDDDWHHPEGLSYNVEQQATKLYGQLNKVAGLPAELRVLDGGHSWEVWGPGFDSGLKYAFDFLTSPGTYADD